MTYDLSGDMNPSSFIAVDTSIRTFVTILETKMQRLYLMGLSIHHSDVARTGKLRIKKSINREKYINSLR